MTDDDIDHIDDILKKKWVQVFNPCNGELISQQIDEVEDPTEKTSNRNCFSSIFKDFYLDFFTCLINLFLF